MCVCAHSVVSNSCDPLGLAHHAPLSLGFSKQEYWSGLPLLPRELPNPGIKPMFPVSPCTGSQILYH